MVQSLLKLSVLFSLTISFVAFTAEAPKGSTLKDLPPELSDKFEAQLFDKVSSKLSSTVLDLWKSLHKADRASLEKQVAGELADEMKEAEGLAKLQESVQMIDLENLKSNTVVAFDVENFKFEKKDGDVYKNQNLKILACMTVVTATEEKIFHIIFESSAVTRVTDRANASVKKEIPAKTEAEAVVTLLGKSPEIKITEFRLTPEDDVHNAREDAIAKDGEGIEGIEDLPVQIQRIPSKPAPKSPAPKSPAPKDASKKVPSII